MANRAVGFPVKIHGKGTQKHRKWVATAKMRLKSGKVYRRAEREDLWAQSELQYIGKHWKDSTDHDSMDLIVINMSFSGVNIIVPYMTGSEPNFLVSPLGQGANPRNAAIQQAFINRIWRAEIRGQDELESGAVDFLIYGDAFYKVGYDIVERRTGGEEAGTYADVAALWVKRINPWDVWLDPTSDGVHNARWVCHRLRMTRDEVEASGYSNTDEISYSKYHKTDTEERGSDSYRQEVFDDTEYAIMYEFYDLVNNYSVLFTDETDSPLKVIEDIPIVPIVQQGNYRIPNVPYHMGELEQIWDIQKELNKTRSQMITHRARNAQKFAAEKGALSGDAKKQLMSPEVNVLVEVETQGRPLDQIFIPLAVANLSADVYNVSGILQEDIYEISGVNEYLRGAAPEIRKTATEATIIEGASNIKTQFKLRQVEKAARQIGTLLLGFAADVYPSTDYEELSLYLVGRDAEMIAKATPDAERVDDQGNPLAAADVSSMTVSPSPEIWVGTYEVLVEQSSTELRNPVLREQKYRGIVMDLIGAMEILGMAGIQIDIGKLILLWFEAAGIDDYESLVKQGGQAGLPPEIQQILAQAQGQGAAAPTGNPEAITQAPPDAVMGAFTDENTGILPPA